MDVSDRIGVFARVVGGDCGSDSAEPWLGCDHVLPVVLRCDRRFEPRVKYVFDTLFMAAGIPIRISDMPPASGPWICYAQNPDRIGRSDACVGIIHSPRAWRVFDEGSDDIRRHRIDGLDLVLDHDAVLSFGPSITGVRFDLVANAFYFLSSWSERVRDNPARASTRLLHADSVFGRLNLPQDVVDCYLARLLELVQGRALALGSPPWPEARWPEDRSFALVLSHDVDYLPMHSYDNAIQGAKTILRHLIRQRRPVDALRAARGWIAATLAGRDPYGCIPEILSREAALGARSSFQVAVARRHKNDVNYRIQSDRVRDYLRAIVDADFDLCLHGSYRSTERSQWYLDEVALLSARLAKPLGSRQHFLSFDYDVLFAAQEVAGIEYDMSLGFPDRPGPRAGFSYPYFPYNLTEDRPYRVLQISLMLMDVTLSGYLRLNATEAGAVVDRQIDDLRAKRGCASAVWHPIVFGGARDPGYGELYFDMIERVCSSGGLATDGRTVNRYWRRRASQYESFSFSRA